MFLTSTFYFGRTLAAAAGLLFLLTIEGPVKAQECTHLDDLKFYEKDFKVREVRIENLLGFSLPIPSGLAAIKPGLPIKPGGDFSLEKREKGRELIEKWLGDAEKNTTLRYRAQAVTAQITNCRENETPRQLDVVYKIFTTNYNAYFSSPWELKSDEIERPATTAATSQANDYLMFTPYAGYDRTSQLFGGAQLQMRTPGGIFDTLKLLGSGSTAGNEVEVELTGSRAPEKTILNRLEYRLGYRHSDWPADNNRLREGTLWLQFFGATRPLSTKGLVMRFGASLEGGNQQTDLTEAAGSEESIASSGYGGLKTYLGATLRTNRLSFAASYGLQIGTRGETTTVDFVKHVGDVALTASWLPKKQTPGEVHKAVTLEAQLSGGAIDTLGKLPVAERFFGGNSVRNFIAGDSWRIRNGPLIRSIPQNRFNSGSTIGAIGGTSFYAFNLTVARPVWGYPIIPKEIAKDPDFIPALRGAKQSSHSILTGVYMSKLKVFDGIVANMEPVRADLAELIALLDSLPDDLPAQLTDELKKELECFGPMTRDRAVTLNRMLEKKSELPSKLETILKDTKKELCVAAPQDPCNEDSEDISDDGGCSLLTTLELFMAHLSELYVKANLTEAGNKVNLLKDSLKTKQIERLKEYEAIDFSEASRLADADMRVVGPVLDAFVDELNWIAVSPVGVFDVARIWPDKYGTRFGIGGGVRITVVNFNVTLGYAFNPNRKPQEGRGALFFSMDVTNLFR